MRVFPMMILCVSLGLGGCDALSPHTNGPLVADSRSPITDVPVPAGFTMAPESSSTVSNGQRLVNHKYTGPDQVLPVASFYKDEMPKRGWKLDGTEQPSGKEVVLHFTKDKAAKPDACTVTVTARDFDTAIRIKIETK